VTQGCASISASGSGTPYLSIISLDFLPASRAEREVGVDRPDLRDIRRPGSIFLRSEKGEGKGRRVNTDKIVRRRFILFAIPLPQRHPEREVSGLAGLYLSPRCQVALPQSIDHLGRRQLNRPDTSFLPFSPKDILHNPPLTFQVTR
jgi:hypothetical protein